jgi:hypothetical protein
MRRFKTIPDSGLDVAVGLGRKQQWNHRRTIFLESNEKRRFPRVNTRRLALDEDCRYNIIFAHCERERERNIQAYHCVMQELSDVTPPWFIEAINYAITATQSTSLLNHSMPYLFCATRSIRIHTCIHTYIYTYIRTYIHSYIHTYIDVYIYHKQFQSAVTYYALHLT